MFCFRDERAIMEWSRTSCEFSRSHSLRSRQWSLLRIVLQSHLIQRNSQARSGRSDHSRVHRWTERSRKQECIRLSKYHCLARWTAMLKCSKDGSYLLYIQDDSFPCIANAFQMCRQQSRRAIINKYKDARNAATINAVYRSMAVPCQQNVRLYCYYYLHNTAAMGDAPVWARAATIYSTITQRSWNITDLIESTQSWSQTNGLYLYMNGRS